MDLVNQVQILYGALCILLCANIFGKDPNPALLPPVIIHSIQNIDIGM